MKYTRLYIFLLAALVLPRLSPLPAQSSSVIPASSYVSGSAGDQRDQSQDAVLTIRKRVDEVHVLFIATNKHGRFVRNLDQADFAILDDHKPPQSIVNFHSETDLPLELGLLVDTSGSVRTRFDFEQESAISFLEQTIRPHFDKAFVMGFSSQSTLTQDFTDNTNLLRIGVDRLLFLYDERPAAIRADQDLRCTSLSQLVAVLARLVGIKRVMRAFDQSDSQSSSR